MPSFTTDDVAGCSSAPLDYENGPDDAAHILFTSGSTGTPKGVVITHANVLRFVEWAVAYFGHGRVGSGVGRIHRCTSISRSSTFSGRSPRAQSSTWSPPS